MELINKLETTVAGWAKNVPHLPVAGQKWLAQNVWWIALIGAISLGIAALFGGLIVAIANLTGSVVVDPFGPSYTSSYLAWQAVQSFVHGAFWLIEGIILAVAIKPLKALQKKGWVLLFFALLVNAVASVVYAVLSLSFGGFVLGIIFGAVGVAIGAYFIFEIRSQFAHSTKATAKKA